MVNERYYFARRNMVSGILFGLGLIAFVDEVVFHQLLRWHHFYDLSTTDIGLISDGLFHAFSWFATIGGLFMFADLKRSKAVWLRRWWSGVLLGAGVFQLYDGFVQHKWMRIHQIRYVENVWMYDLVWYIVSVLLILFGLVLWRQTRRKLRQVGW